MRDVIASIEGEYRRYRKLAEDTFDQLDDEQLQRRPTEESNSVATLAWHISGNLESRFSGFLTTDGEKPWRQRDDEFAVRVATHAEVREKWARGWDVLMSALADLTDADLERMVTIRGVSVSVGQALHRSLAHTASHVGQITYLGKMFCGAGWAYLSIVPGGDGGLQPESDARGASLTVW